MVSRAFAAMWFRVEEMVEEKVEEEDSDDRGSPPQRSKAKHKKSDAR